MTDPQNCLTADGAAILVSYHSFSKVRLLDNVMAPRKAVFPQYSDVNPNTAGSNHR